MTTSSSSLDTRFDQLWLSHSSCASWREPSRWSTYFTRVQEVLQAEITHLDENDPVRRRPTGLVEAGEYMTRFGPGEDSRTVFGRIKKIGAEFTIWYFRDELRRRNLIYWCFPSDFLLVSARTEAISKLFEVGNRELSAFYGYSDRNRVQMMKTRETGAIDSFSELLGVFWLTYFDHHYVEFFGKEKLALLDRMGIAVDFNAGATLRLAETPESVPIGLRKAAEEFLGYKTFVDPKDLSGKQPGKYVLTFEQLRV